MMLLTLLAYAWLGASVAPHGGATQEGGSECACIGKLAGCPGETMSCYVGTTPLALGRVSCTPGACNGPRKCLCDLTKTASTKCQPFFSTGLVPKCYPASSRQEAERSVGGAGQAEGARAEAEAKPFGGECYFSDRKFAVGGNVIKTVAAVECIEMCQALCVADPGCAWVQLEAQTNNCDLMKGALPDGLAGAVAAPGWLGATQQCKVPTSVGEAAARVLDGVPSKLLIVAAAGGVVAAAGAVAFVTWGKTRAAGGEYAPLSPA